VVAANGLEIDEIFPPAMRDPRSTAAILVALPIWELIWSSVAEWRCTDSSARYYKLLYVFPAYYSRADNVANGADPKYCSRAAITRVN
jgi:hypothetical protein